MCVCVCLSVVCLSVCVSVGICGVFATVYMWRSEDSLLECVLSCYCMGCGAQTQFIGLGSKRLCLLSHPADPVSISYAFQADFKYAV